MDLRDIPIPLSDYFEQTPNVLGGTLRLRGMRVSIEQILELLEAGVTPKEIVQSFPSVTLNAIATVERQQSAEITPPHPSRCCQPARRI
jgi:uncharacterized protein (DUF433 family)